MATQSNPSPNDEKLQNSVSEPIQPTTDEKQDGQTATRESSTPSVFVNSEPIREDQVQNAVNFLSHPRVRGSPVIYRRSFLEKKGLTIEEIDEAFRRVPDPPATATSAQAMSTNQDGHLKPSSNIQTQAPAQNLQPAAATTAAPKTGIMTRFHWSHAALAVGLLAASGAGTAVLLKNAVVPWLKSWMRKVVLEEDDLVKKTDSRPSPAEEVAAAAKAAAVAAADIAKASQEMLHSNIAERRYFEEFTNRLDIQVQEMKSMSKAIQKLEERALVEKEYRGSIASLKPSYVNGKVDVDVRSVRSSSPPASVDTSIPLHPKSHTEIMAMVQRGEIPPNIQDIDDLPLNFRRQPSNPRVVSRAKPWEVGQAQRSSTEVFQSSSSSEGLNCKVRNDGFSSHLNGDNSTAAWGQQRSAKVAEIETENELKTGPYGITNQPPVRRWVPPQPPPVVMPEAAAAIRQPKQSVCRDQTDDDQSSAHSSDGIDELQRITKISELGGVMETNGGNSELSSSAIQEEAGYSVEPS